MTEHILFCSSCKRYTLEKVCSSCGRVSIIPRPPKYTFHDKYASYRRETKKKELIEKGLY